VLFSSRAPIGYCVIAKNELTTSQGFKSLIPNSEQNAEFLRYYLLSAKEYAESLASGTTFKELSGSRMGRLAMPIPPLAEQCNIVAKLDSLTGRTARAFVQLERIPRLIQKYRETILSAAFGGELTHEWRAEHSVVAASIVSLASLCETITDGDHQAPPQAIRGVPFITISAMNDGHIRLEKATRFVPREYVATLKPSRLPRRGDVRYSVTGSFGIPALVENDAEFVFQRHIAILKPDAQKTSGTFLHRILESPQALEQARSVATGTAQLTVPLSGLRMFEVPCPTLAEQEEILRRIETAFAWLDRVAAEHVHASRLLPRLEHAISMKALRDELVRGKSGDEAAPVARGSIQAKEATSPNSRQRKTRSNTTTHMNRLAMSKKRSDLDVKGRPYLTQKLKELGGTKSIEQLFQAADLTLVDFYKQLSDEFDKGWLRKISELVEAA
jgi:type I restriction enzyme S subunit